MTKTKIAFKATEQMRSYDDRPAPWTDGDVRAVDKEKADHLLETFPMSFIPADKYSETKAKELVDEEKAARADLDDRYGGGEDGNDGDPTLDSTIADQLKSVEVELWVQAAKKADAGEDLSDKEMKIMDKVDKLMQS